MSVEEQWLDPQRNRERFNRFYKVRGDFRRRSRADAAYVRSLVKHYGLQKGQRLADVGCGTGYYAGLFEQRGLDAVGIDISEIGLRQGQRVYRSVEYVVADAFRMPFQPSSFDLIFAGGLSPFNVENLARVEGLGRHLFDLLRPGGLFIFYWSTDLSLRWTRAYIWEFSFNHDFNAVRRYFEGLGHEILDISISIRPLAHVMGEWIFHPLWTQAVRLATWSLRPLGITNKLTCVVRKHQVLS